MIKKTICLIENIDYFLEYAALLDRCDFDDDVWENIYQVIDKIDLVKKDLIEIFHKLLIMDEKY